jgi:hypothetical protein
MPKDSDGGTDGQIVLLSQTTWQHCRWIVGQPKRGVHVVCGRRVRPGSSFCNEHHALVWRSVAGERKGSAVQSTTRKAKAEDDETA